MVCSESLNHQRLRFANIILVVRSTTRSSYYFGSSQIMPSFVCKNILIFWDLSIVQLDQGELKVGYAFQLASRCFTKTKLHVRHITPHFYQLLGLMAVGDFFSNEWKYISYQKWKFPVVWDQGNVLSVKDHKCC